MPDNNSQADDSSGEAGSALDGEDPAAAAAADDDGAASSQAQNPDPDHEEQGSGAPGPAENDPAAEEGERAERDDPAPEEGERAERDDPRPRDVAMARFLREINAWTRDQNVISYVVGVLAAGEFDGEPEFVVENNVLHFAGIPIAELERPVQYGLSYGDLRRIPGRTYEAPKCSICDGVFNEDDYIRKLPCRHEFHSSCLVDRLSTSSTCPLCGKEIVT